MLPFVGQKPKCGSGAGVVHLLQTVRGAGIPPWSRKPSETHRALPGGGYCRLQSGDESTLLAAIPSWALRGEISRSSRSRPGRAGITPPGFCGGGNPGKARQHIQNPARSGTEQGFGTPPSQIACIYQAGSSQESGKNQAGIRDARLHRFRRRHQRRTGPRPVLRMPAQQGAGAKRHSWYARRIVRGRLAVHRHSTPVADADVIAVARRQNPIAKSAAARIARTGHRQVSVPVRSPAPTLACATTPPRTTPPAICPDEPRRATLVTVDVSIGAVEYLSPVHLLEPERQADSIADSVTRSPSQYSTHQRPSRPPATSRQGQPRPGRRRPSCTHPSPGVQNVLFSYGRCTAVSVSTITAMYLSNRGDVSADRNQG